MTELFKKLNFKGQTPILVLDPPPSFEAELAAMASETKVARKAKPEATYAFALAFVTMKKDFDRDAALLALVGETDAILWIAYPKKSSPAFQSDLTRDLCFETGLTLGLRANRQVAVDDDWSAMRYKRL